MTRIPEFGRFAEPSLLILVNALWNDLARPIMTGTSWGPSAAGLIVIGLGIPVYYFFARKSES